MTEPTEATPQKPVKKVKSGKYKGRSKQQSQNELSRKMRMEAKAVVLKLEKDNKDHIFLFASTGGWWKITSNSLLFYFDLVAPALPTAPTRMQDKDYDLATPYGVTPFASIAAFQEKLNIAEANIVPDDTLDFGKYADFIRAFRLPAPYSDKDIRALRTADAAARDRFASRILDCLPDVTLASKIREACHICFRLALKVDPRAAKILGNRFYENVQNLYYDYFDFANCSEVPEQTPYLQAMFVHSNNALLALSIYNFTRIFEPIMMEDSLFALTDIRDYVRRELDKRAGHDIIKERYDAVKNPGEISQA